MWKVQDEHPQPAPLKAETASRWNLDQLKLVRSTPVPCPCSTSIFFYFNIMDTEHGHEEELIRLNNDLRRAEAAWETAESVPLISSAAVEHSRGFSVVYGQSCIATGKTVSYVTHAVWDPDEGRCTAESRPRPLLAEARLHASRGDVDVEILRQKGDAGGPDIDVANVFKGEGRLAKSLHLGGQNLHGAVHFGGVFAGIAISPDLQRAAFVAEAKDERGGSFFGNGDTGRRWAPAPSRGPRAGQEALYKDDFGEQLEGKRDPTIVQLDLGTYRLNVRRGLPENWCPGQLVYHPDGKSIIGSAYILGPRKLGLWACSNRPRVIFLLDASGSYQILSREENVSAESPRVSPEGKFLYWMERDICRSDLAYGPHQACRRLVRRRIDVAAADGDGVETVVPVVQTAPASGSCRRTPFRGLFFGELPKRPFSADGRFVILSTVSGDRKVVVVVDVEAKEVAVIEDPEEGFPSMGVLDVHLDIVLAEGSSPKRAPALMCGALDTSRGRPLKERLVIQSPKCSRPYVEWPLEYREVCVSRKSARVAYADVQASAILVMPPLEGPGARVPLIVFLHGGPNSSYQTAFYKQVFFFNQLGYAALLVNFVGSTGKGQDNIDALVGRLGDWDVEDCYDAVQSCLEVEGRIARDEVYLYGGSHGGFLALHLGSRYPDAFRAIVVRNPVTNRATKAAATDIPDLDSNAAGLSYDYLPLNPDAMRKLHEVSPIAHVGKMKAPVCLLLGKRDARVPPYQGREYYHALKALGKEARMYEYDDNHSLAKVATAANAMVNAAMFFFELNGSGKNREASSHGAVSQ